MSKIAFTVNSILQDTTNDQHEFELIGKIEELYKKKNIFIILSGDNNQQKQSQDTLEQLGFFEKTNLSRINLKFTSEKLSLQKILDMNGIKILITTKVEDLLENITQIVLQSAKVQQIDQNTQHQKICTLWEDIYNYLIQQNQQNISKNQEKKPQDKLNDDSNVEPFSKNKKYLKFTDVEDNNINQNITKEQQQFEYNKKEEEKQNIEEDQYRRKSLINFNTDRKSIVKNLIQTEQKDMDLAQLVVNVDFRNIETYALENSEKFQQQIKTQFILHMACKLGYLQVLKVLIECIQKFDMNMDLINQQDQQGATPLHYTLQASEDGTPELLDELMNYKLNPNIQDFRGFTALHEAASKGQEHIVEKLLKIKNINPNLQTQDQKLTPIMIAIDEGQYNIISMLTDITNLKITDYEGSTVMHHAAVTKGNSPVYIKHLSNYCDINSQNFKKETPIKMALNLDINKYSRAIETLIALNCDLSIKDSSDESALQFLEKSSQIFQNEFFFKGIIDSLKKRNITLKMKSLEIEYLEIQTQKKSILINSTEKSQIKKPEIRSNRRKLDREEIFYLSAILPLLMIVVYLAIKVMNKEQ